jgi:hypothetical protein
MRSWLLAGFALGTALAAPMAAAEEGLWLPGQVPALSEHLVSLGARLGADAFADLSGGPAAAVARLGNCSASFVSPAGLLLTNYHCAYGSLKARSTPERNLLQAGFLARSGAEELPALPHLRVRVTLAIDDVTARVAPRLSGLSGAERARALEALAEELDRECRAVPGERCDLSSLHGGAAFARVRQRELTDLRLVYAPPEDLGRYGGEHDNFAWPRATADFALFRAYTRDGGAAPQPFRPARHLVPAHEPLHEGDFVAVIGYPNATNRYRAAAEVEEAFGWRYPKLVASYGTWLRELRAAVAGRPEAAFKYAGTDAELSNTMKFAEGLAGSPAASAIERERREQEQQLARWIDADPGRRAAYGAAWRSLEEALARRREGREQRWRFHLATRSSLLGAARRLYRDARERERPDASRADGYREADRDELRQQVEGLDARFDPAVDRAVWRAFLLDYHELPAGQRRPDLDAFFGLVPGRSGAAAVDRTLARLYRGTAFGDRSRRLLMLDARRGALDASADPFLRLARALYDGDLAAEEADERLTQAIEAARPVCMEALLRFRDEQGRPAYPDANGTLRVSFGRVEGYRRADGARAQPFTLAADLLATNAGRPPYQLPADVLQRLRDGRFGPYRDPQLGSLPVNFLASVDVAGGNSGSPTLNARGELVGVLFDTNREGILSSWDYDAATARSIHLDIRYGLWLLAAQDAHRLLAEMGAAAAPATAAGAAP